MLETAEIYFASALTRDKNMQQVFINIKEDPVKYADFHGSIAHMVFNPNCEPSEVKKLFKSLRQASKEISFGILFGSGARTVAESINESQLEEYVEALKFAEDNGLPLPPKPIECTPSKAQEYIDIYFDKFPEVKRWIETKHREITQNGYVYSHFGRKRRLHNVKSEDRGTVGGELRSGLNALIQGASSDTLLLGAIDADEEIMRKGLEKDIQIIMLVHDSVVAIVREDLVPYYEELIVSCIQKDRGLSIEGCPIGVSSDSEEGGSLDYSCGKVKKQHVAIAMIDDPEYTQYIKDLINSPDFYEKAKDPKSLEALVLKDLDNIKSLYD